MNSIILAWIVGFIIGTVLHVIAFFFKFKRETKKQTIGDIEISYDVDNERYNWNFLFKDKITYDAIPNMDYVTFKIKKGVEHELHRQDGNKNENVE